MQYRQLVRPGTYGYNIKHLSIHTYEYYHLRSLYGRTVCVCMPVCVYSIEIKEKFHFYTLFISLLRFVFALFRFDTLLRYGTHMHIQPDTHVRARIYVRNMYRKKNIHRNGQTYRAR